eukprot:50191_1
MMQRVLTLLMITATTRVLSQFDAWITSNTNLLRNVYGMATAYDIINDRIWLIGGVKDRNQLMSYENNGDITDYGKNYLSAEIFGLSQYYTTLDNTLWLI